MQRMIAKIIKQINIAWLVLILFIGMTGCENDKEKNTKTETPAATTSATGEPDKNIIEKKKLPENSYGTIKDGVYTATQGALQMSVPNTWGVSEEDATILVAGTEEDTKDCVTIHVTEKDNQFNYYKQEDFEKAYEELFDNLEFEEFQHTKIGNLNAIYIKYVCSKDNTDIVQYQYMLDGESTYLIGFTDVSGELEKEIQTCMDSLVICR